MADDFKRVWRPYGLDRKCEAMQLRLQADMIIEITSQLFRETNFTCKSKTIWNRYERYTEAARQMDDRRRRMVPQIRRLANGVIEPVVESNK